MFKKLVPYLVVGFMFACGYGSIAGQKLAKSSLKVDGRYLTQDEAKDALRELVPVLRNLDINDPASFESIPEVKSPIARRLVEAIRRRAKTERDYTAATDGLDLSVILSNERLGSPEGRAKSRVELTRLREASSRYYSDSAAGIVAYGEAVHEIGADTSMGTTLTETSRAQTELRLLTERVHELAEKILTFTEAKKPVKSDDGKYLLFDKQDLAKFNEIAEEYDHATKVAVERSNELTEGQKAAFTKNLSEMESATGDR